MSLSKRGQESGGLGTIIIAVVLVVCAVLLILGMSGVWSSVDKGLNAQDPSMISAIAGCKTSVSVAGNAGYCTHWKDVEPKGGVQQYMTCQYIQEVKKFANFTSDETVMNCGTPEQKLAEAEKQCVELWTTHLENSDTKNWKEYVNRQVCQKDGQSLMFAKKDITAQITATA